VYRWNVARGSGVGLYVDGSCSIGGRLSTSDASEPSGVFATGRGRNSIEITGFYRIYNH